MRPQGFIRVSKSKPCPVCGKPDWCLVAKDGTAAICPRVPSHRLVSEEAGFLHKLAETCSHHVSWSPTQPPPIDATSIMQRYWDAMAESDYQSCANELGVSVDALLALSTGRADQYCEGTYAWPMRNEHDQIIGVRLRNREGHKWSVYGSKTGLFYGSIKADEVIYVCEGPTDAAALISLGKTAIGKPSCSGGNNMLLAMIRRIKPPMVVIVADMDAKSGRCDFCDDEFCQHCRPGQFGAEKTARTLAPLGVPIKIIEPVDAKDIRQWYKQGGTKRGLQRLVECALLWTR